MFGIASRLLGAEDAAAQTAGELWSLVDGAHHCSDPRSRQFLIEQASLALEAMPKTMPRQLRPLTILAALAAADLIGEGRGLVRLAAAARHRLFGTLPRS